MKPTAKFLTLTAALMMLAVLPACARVLAPFLPDDSNRLQKLEQRMLDADALHMRFAIQAAGAFGARLSGTLDLDEQGHAVLRAQGEFGGKPVDLGLVADGKTLHLKGPEGERDMPQPAHLRESLLIGMTRMGLLHNLARLVAGHPPDHADGGVRDWVTADNVQLVPPMAADEPVGKILGFDIRVADEPSGHARLTLDSPHGMPTLRLQEVNFESGVMQVTEQYRIKR